MVMNRNNFLFKMAIVALLSINCAFLNAQVTIGDNTPPQSYSLLELISNGNKQGLRLPQINSLQCDSLADLIKTAGDAAHGLQFYNTDINCVVYWNGRGFQDLCSTRNWFYMPSIPLDVSRAGDFTYDLHLEYFKQFADGDHLASITLGSPLEGNPIISSPSAAPYLKVYDNPINLDYYVIGYDASVFEEIEISNEGVLTYRIEHPENVTDATYMNIIFVVK